MYYNFGKVKYLNTENCEIFYSIIILFITLGRSLRKTGIEPVITGLAVRPAATADLPLGYVLYL